MKWLVLATLVACGHPAPAGGNSGSVPPGGDTGACTKDEDCQLVDQCCDCNNGGGRIAIRADQLGHYRDQHAKECGGMVCTAQISTDASCNAEAACHDGRCTVQPHLGDDTHSNPRPPM
jgi:hypothetical protein